MRILTLLVAGLICFCVGNLSPAAAAEKECAQWTVPLPWIGLYQDNGFNVILTPEEDQRHGIRGQASYSSGGDKTYGLFEGHVTSKKIVFTVHWNNGSEGGYEGTISPQGYVEGFTYDKNAQGSNAGFKISDLLNCTKWVAPESPPSPPPQQQSSGPQPPPDVIMHNSDEQAGTLPPANGNVLVPTPSTGPSPFGDAPPPSEPLTQGKGVGAILQEMKPCRSKVGC